MQSKDVGIAVAVLLAVAIAVALMYRSPDALPHTFVSSSHGFSIRYPAGYSADESYVYQELGPGKDIRGVKFTVPPTLTAGTNLGGDTGVAVEQIPNLEPAPIGPGCGASLFLDLAQGGTVQTVTDNGTEYSLASTTGAGAGNFYEEWVWALPNTSPCTAVRYFIHSGNIGNYPPGAVREFDRAALFNDFDPIRHSLKVGQQI